MKGNSTSISSGNSEIYSGLFSALLFLFFIQQITFLVESAERGHEIDVDRALQAKERAEKRLLQAREQQEKIDRTRAEAAMQRALARLKIAQRQ